MIFHPAVIALCLVSFLISGMVLYASFFGFRILKRWDLASGSEEQLALERRTYLVSTILCYVLVFQIGSLFLYIYTADSLHSFFVGAMCAAGSLNANRYGYPTLLLKILNFVLAGLWLIVNHTDNQAYDYPLIRMKYWMLLMLAPFVLAETVLQAVYFARLKADIITSCCGSIFSPQMGGVASDIAGLPAKPAMVAFFSSLILTGFLGVVFLSRQKLGRLFSLSSTILFLTSGVALISFISLYFYELPTHHCPFCVLQKEYGYVGYLLYAALLAGVVSGLGVGVLMPFREISSLSQ